MSIQLPSDVGGRAVQITPVGVALSRTVDDDISSSTEITLHTGVDGLPDTRFVRVYAKDKDVYLKWGTDNVTSSNFDEIIPANQVVDLAVPYQSDGHTLFTALNVIQAEATAKIRIIEK